MDYMLTSTLDVDEDRNADAVVVNEAGAWLAEWDSESGSAIPFTDEGGQYIAAPADWKKIALDEFQPTTKIT